MKWQFWTAAVLAGLVALATAQQTSAVPQAQPTAQPAPRPTPPTRNPHTPGYVDAQDLPDGTLPAANADGNFIIGPTHTPAPAMTATELTNGSVVEFTMSSADSKYYP